MALSPIERVRYARHLLLPELGLDGQARLCAASYRVSGDEAAARVAVDYLGRAGLARGRDGDGGAVSVAVPAADAIDGLAGRPELREAAAALAGAFAAVEAIKVVAGAGRASTLASEFSLISESTQTGSRS